MKRQNDMLFSAPPAMLRAALPPSLMFPDNCVTALTHTHTHTMKDVNTLHFLRMVAFMVCILVLFSCSIKTHHKL